MSKYLSHFTVFYLLTWICISSQSENACSQLEQCDCSQGIKTNVDCSKKKISSVPRLSRFPPRTVNINLEGNVITSITTEDESVLEELVSLNLDDNYIKNINFGELMVHFPKLKNLGVKHNLIQSISSGTGIGGTFLVMVNLGHNLISSITEGDFKGLKRLTYLHLNHNKISFIDKAGFDGLSNLKHLWLESNQLSYVDSSWFNHVKEIESLQLSDNRISQFYSEDRFQWPPSLYELNLSRNAMTILPALPQDPNLHLNGRSEEWKVDLIKNPLYCGCRSEGYNYNYIQGLPICSIKLMCTEPRNMADLSISNDDHCNETRMKSFWKEYSNMKACQPPKITKLEVEDLGINRVVCEAKVNENTTMILLGLDNKEVIKKINNTFDFVDVLQINTTLIKEGWIRCHVDSIQGQDYRDLFVYRPIATHCIQDNITNTVYLNRDPPVMSSTITILGMITASVSLFIFTVICGLLMFNFMIPLNTDINIEDDSNAYLELHSIY